LDGDVIVNIGDDSFTLQTIGDGLSISKGLNNNIVFSSNDLSFINTEDPLE